MLYVLNHGYTWLNTIQDTPCYYLIFTSMKLINLDTVISDTEVITSRQIDFRDSSLITGRGRGLQNGREGKSMLFLLKRGTEKG